MGVFWVYYYAKCIVKGLIHQAWHETVGITEKTFASYILRFAHPSLIVEIFVLSVTFLDNYLFPSFLDNLRAK